MKRTVCVRSGCEVWVHVLVLKPCGLRVETPAVSQSCSKLSEFGLNLDVFTLVLRRVDSQRTLLCFRLRPAGVAAAAAPPAPSLIPHTEEAEDADAGTETKRFLLNFVKI